MATLFVSDLHLHPSRPRAIAAFVDLLDTLGAETDALYILGDLFETWVGDDHPEPAYAAVKQALRRATAAGRRIGLLHGNRDFLIGERFAAETGCRLLPDPSEIDLYGTRTLLMHGDSLCAQDTDYQALRTRLRDPAWQRQALSLPVAERMALAGEARDLSVNANRDKDEGIMDVDADAVRRVFDDQRIGLLIHGHTHRPAVHAFEHGGRNCRRVVLGDWYRRGSLLHVDRQSLELRELTL